MKGLSAWVVSLLAVAAASHCSSEDGPSIDAVTEGGVDSVDVAYDLPVEGIRAALSISPRP
jgi:hypothetical protein